MTHWRTPRDTLERRAAEPPHATAAIRGDSSPAPWSSEPKPGDTLCLYPACGCVSICSGTRRDHSAQVHRLVPFEHCLDCTCAPSEQCSGVRTTLRLENYAILDKHVVLPPVHFGRESEPILYDPCEQDDRTLGLIQADALVIRGQQRVVASLSAVLVIVSFLVLILAASGGH